TSLTKDRSAIWSSFRVLAVPVAERAERARHAEDRGRLLVVAVGDVDRDPAAVGVFDDVGPAAVGDGEIAQLGAARIDDLVRLAAGGCSDAIAGADGHAPI